MASFDSSRTAGAASPEFSIDREVAVMKTMTVNKLAEKYDEVHGYAARSRNKQWLIKRIAWQMQANIYGGLSERALARAAELVKGAQLRMLPPREWDTLTSGEKTRVLSLLVEQVIYDGVAGQVSITFRPAGLQSLGAELGGGREVAA